MKKNYFFAFLLFIAFLTTLDAGAQNLAVRKADGTEFIVSLSQLQNITFLGDNVELNYVSGSADSFALSSVGNIYFTSKSSGVNIVENANQTISVYPNPARNFINITNIQETTNISAYRIDGTKIFDKKVSSGDQSLSISNLPSGIYILKANNQVIKFIKQ